MPRIKSAKKRVLSSEKRRQVNMARKSTVKTAIKKVLVALEAKNVDQAALFLKDATAQIARAKGKGVLHRNTAVRKISRLAKKVAQAANAA